MDFLVLYYRNQQAKYEVKLSVVISPTAQEKGVAGRGESDEVGPGDDDDTFAIRLVARFSRCSRVNYTNGSLTV